MGSCRFLSSEPYPEQFFDIAPFEDNNFKERLSHLITDPGFEHAVKYIWPDINYSVFCKDLLDCEIIDDFQRK